MAHDYGYGQGGQYQHQQNQAPPPYQPQPYQNNYQEQHTMPPQNYVDPNMSQNSYDPNMGHQPGLMGTAPNQPPMAPPQASIDPNASAMSPKVYFRADKDAYLDFRVILPNDEFPKTNFAGRIIGHKGQTIAELKRKYNCKLYLNTDDKQRPGDGFDPRTDPPHVRIQMKGPLSDIMRRFADISEDLNQRFKPDWRDPEYLNQKEKADATENKSLAFVDPEELAKMGSKNQESEETEVVEEIVEEVVVEEEVKNDAVTDNSQEEFNQEEEEEEATQEEPTPKKAKITAQPSQTQNKNQQYQNQYQQQNNKNFRGRGRGRGGRGDFRGNSRGRGGRGGNFRGNRGGNRGGYNSNNSYNNSYNNQNQGYQQNQTQKDLANFNNQNSGNYAANSLNMQPVDNSWNQQQHQPQQPPVQQHYTGGPSNYTGGAIGYGAPESSQYYPPAANQYQGNVGQPSPSSVAPRGRGGHRFQPSFGGRY